MCGQPERCDLQILSKNQKSLAQSAKVGLGRIAFSTRLLSISKVPSAMNRVNASQRFSA